MGFFSEREALTDGRWRVVDFIACRLDANGLVLEAHVWASHPLQVAIRGWQVPAQPGVPQGWIEPQFRKAHTLLVALAAAVRGRGRPRGTGTFESREAFLSVVGEAVQELRRKRANPTAAAVRRHLSSKLGVVRREVFTRWYQKFGFPTWQDVLASIPPAEFSSTSSQHASG